MERGSSFATLAYRDLVRTAHCFPLSCDFPNPSTFGPGSVVSFVPSLIVNFCLLLTRACCRLLPSECAQCSCLTERAQFFLSLNIGGLGFMDSTGDVPDAALYGSWCGTAALLNR
jgi:hypothetical protein